MKEKRSLVALGALAAVLAACSSNVGGGTPSDNTGGSGATSAGAGPGSGGLSGKAGTAGSGAGPGTCVPGIPATTQIPRMLNRQYDSVLRDLLGVTTVDTDGKPPSSLLYDDFTGPMTPDAWRLYQSAAAQLAHAVMTGPNQARFISCDPAAADCLKTTIQTFGRKAFRRPLTDAEVARFQKLSQTTPVGTPAEVAETTLLAFLVSPSFLLIPELTPTSDPAAQATLLSNYEVATRLSFLLWGSVPDDILNAAADANLLTTKEQILAQAQRMIVVREKTGQLVASFHRDWVQVNNANAHWWKIDHDPAKYPLYTATAKTSFQAELDDFFQEVAFTGGSFKDLFTSNIGFVNQDNAAIYGLDPAAYGTELKRVELDPAQRPGFLTRAGFLSSYSHYDSTSPILRGAFLTVYMLGVDPGPPLPGAAMQTVTGSFATNREYTDALTGKEPCKTCHNAIINPGGYVFENYDAIGKWQTVDPRGGPIDAAATVTFSSTNSKAISSPLQMMQEIAQTPNTKQIYSQKWVSYAFGRQPNPNDQCIVDQLNTKLVENDYTVLNLLADLTQADSFRSRVQETP